MIKQERQNPQPGHVSTPSETGRMYFLLRCLKLKLAEAQSSLFLVEKDPGAGPGSQARAYPVVDFGQARSQYPILSYWKVLTVPSYIGVFLPQF